MRVVARITSCHRVPAPIGAVRPGPVEADPTHAAGGDHHGPSAGTVGPCPRFMAATARPLRAVSRTTATAAAAPVASTITTGWWLMPRAHRINRGHRRHCPAGTSAPTSAPVAHVPGGMHRGHTRSWKQRTQPPQRPGLPSGLLGGGDPRGVGAAAHQGLELLGHAGVDRWHGHAAPAQVADHLARVPQRPDPVGVHHRSPSVGRRWLETSRS
jgi:hypothetical protein